MKKLLSILAIATIALSSTFATTDTNNVVINGYVTEVPYSFNLKYSNENADSSNSFLLAEEYNLALTSVQSTSSFSLQRSSGNLNEDLSVAVDITAKAFEGSVNGEDVVTGIIPAIVLENDEAYGYADITSTPGTASNVKSFNLTVPYGYNPEVNEEIASFKLNITGDATTDAGTYTSDVVINYIYDQN